MYLSYYKLNKKPFQISTDPNFFWLGEKLKEALSTLTYGVMDDKGFLLLTGDVGTGKTTLINAFVNSLGDDVIISRVSDPGLTQLDFVNYIAKMFKIKTKFETKSEFIILFTQFLEQAHEDNKKVLLIIDEAQHLTDETLEEIRLLSNIENQDKKLLNIFLVGQSEFNETLEKYKNRALRQRLTLNFTLYPLEPEETKACIEYRLKVAGSVNQIFSPEAIDAVHTISNGVPRVINIICDHALRLGCQEKQEIISDTLIHRCSKTLQAVHLPNTHQYDSHFGSTDDWLEESEVPPLSPEAIDKVSQPLPDFIIDNKEEQTEKRKTSRKIVPLLVTAVLISMVFLFMDGYLASISKVITNLIKDTIASTSTKPVDVNDSPKLQQQGVDLPPTETITGENSGPSFTAVITTTQKKKAFETTVSEEVIETTPPETTIQTIDPEPQTTTPSDVVEVIGQSNVKEVATSTSISADHTDVINDEILKQEPDVSDVTATPPVIVKDDQSEEIEEDINIESTKLTQSQLSVTQTPTATDTTNKIKLETTQTSTEKDVISLDTATEAPNQTVSQTQTVAGNDFDIKTETAPQSEVESSSKNRTVAPPQTKVKPDLEKPEEPEEIEEPEEQAIPSAGSETNDDPGAVIDWLLKSR